MTPRAIPRQAALPMGILQARVLEWVAVPLSRESSQPRDRTQVSSISGGFFTVWATGEAQEYWSRWPIPSPGDLPNPGIEPGSPALQTDSLATELWGKPPGHATSLQKDLRVRALHNTHRWRPKSWILPKSRTSHTTLLFELLASPILESSWLFLEISSAKLLSRPLHLLLSLTWFPQISTRLVSLLTRVFAQMPLF